jgi:outer membrane lipoprotein-sorting protein
MRKIMIVVGLAILAIGVTAFQSGAGLLSNFSKALNEASTVSVTYNVQPIGGTPAEYTVELAKPNMVKIVRGNETIVADGTTITTYTKADNTYFKQPQTAEGLAALFGEDDLALWQSFFKVDALSKVINPKNAGVKNRKGMSLTQVDYSVDQQGRKSVSLYLDGNHVAQQAMYTTKDESGEFRMLVDIKQVNLGSGQADKATFTFTPPAGARELSLDEMNSGKWWENLEEAKAFAKKTNKLVLIDFNADW